MDARRSFYLNSKQDDFTDLSAEMRRPGPADIPYVISANDNMPASVRLSARCRSMLLRLIAMHSLN